MLEGTEKRSERLLMWRQQQTTYFVVREEGMGWGGKTLMEVYVTDDRRFLSHACLEPKVERDQDALHFIIPYRNKTCLGLVFSPTIRLDSQ